MVLILCICITSCQTWKKILYGKDACGNAWQMEKGQTQPSMMRQP